MCPNVVFICTQTCWLYGTARLFHREITKQEDGFTANRGWLNSFKHRQAIRRLKITGKKLSCDEESIKPFRNELQRVKCKQFGPRTNL